MPESSSSSSDHLRRNDDYQTVHRSFADNNQHSKKAELSGSNQTISSTNHQGVDKSNSNTVAGIQTSKRWVPVTPAEYRNWTRGPLTLSQKQARETSNIVYYVPERTVHPSMTRHLRYPTQNGKQSAKQQKSTVHEPTQYSSSRRSLK